MPKIDEKYSIRLDLDKERIRAVLREAYSTVRDLLTVAHFETEQEFVSKADKYIESNRVSIPFTLTLGSRPYPDLVIDVDPRKCSVFARFNNRNKQAEINRYLKAL